MWSLCVPVQSGMCTLAKADGGDEGTTSEVAVKETNRLL